MKLWWLNWRKKYVESYLWNSRRYVWFTSFNTNLLNKLYQTIFLIFHISFSLNDINFLIWSLPCAEQCICVLIYNLDFCTWPLNNNLTWSLLASGIASLKFGCILKDVSKLVDRHIAFKVYAIQRKDLHLRTKLGRLSYCCEQGLREFASKVAIVHVILFESYLSD